MGNQWKSMEIHGIPGILKFYGDAEMHPLRLFPGFFRLFLDK